MRLARTTGAAATIAALLGTTGLSSGEEPARGTTVRDCGSRGEPSAVPRRTDTPIGPSLRAHSLGGFEDAPASQFASRADDVGFRRFIHGPRGRADRRRARWLRLAPTHYGQLKTPVSVRAGHTVTLTVVPEDRPYVSFFFDHRRSGRQVGPYWSFRVSDGRRAVRFKACRASQPRFSGPGPVGPWTTYPGAMLVAGARCVTLEVRERGRPTTRLLLGFGRDDCRPTPDGRVPAGARG